MKFSHQIAIVAALSLIPTVAHYATDVHNGPAHDIYQRFYYLPVILAGLWFGARGAVLTSTLIAVAYFPHAIHGWHGPHSMFYRLMEVAMYLVVGALTGWLSDRLREANDAERRARTEAESAYLNLKTKTEELFALEEQLRRTDRLSALGQLSAGLAHEIRNPLASIKTSIELLRSRDRAERAPDEPDFTGIILEETHRLDHILTGFLQFARAEQTRPVDEPCCTNFLAAIRHVLDLTESRRIAQGIRVSLEASRLNVSVALCESHLRQVLLNLVLNSIDAMPFGGEFRVHAEGNDSKAIVVSIEDSGPGVPLDMATKVFDPFFTTKEHGTGLGLSIVERILDSHGGSISLASVASGTMSRFILRLPLTQQMV